MIQSHHTSPTQAVIKITKTKLPSPINSELPINIHHQDLKAPAAAKKGKIRWWNDWDRITRTVRLYRVEMSGASLAANMSCMAVSISCFSTNWLLTHCCKSHVDWKIKYSSENFKKSIKSEDFKTVIINSRFVKVYFKGCLPFQRFEYNQFRQLLGITKAYWGK